MTSRIIFENECYFAEVRNDDGELIFNGVPRGTKVRALEDCDWFLERGKYAPKKPKQGTLFKEQ